MPPPSPPLVLTVEITLVPVCVCVCAAQLTIGNSDGKEGSTKVLIFTEYHSVYVPSSELGLSNPPSLASECAPPPGTKGGGGAQTTGEKAEHSAYSVEAGLLEFEKKTEVLLMSSLL